MTAPTGAGKSLLFQLPALYLALEYNLLTLVIEPLKSLMHDQVAGLKARGVKDVIALNSDISYQQRLEGYRKIADGSVSIVYLAPELLLESSIDTILNGRRLGLVVVDEVHTVSSWGREFRPDYWYLGSYLKRLRANGGSFQSFALPPPPFMVARTIWSPVRCAILSWTIANCISVALDAMISISISAVSIRPTIPV